MQKMTVERQIYVASGKEMADMMGISPRRLQQLIAEEWVTGKIGRNEFDVTEVLVSYRDFLRRK